MQAQQLIHLGQLDPTDYQGAYAIYLDAFGDEALARKAQSAAAKNFADMKIAQHEKKR